MSQFIPTSASFKVFACCLNSSTWKHGFICIVFPLLETLNILSKKMIKVSSIIFLLVSCIYSCYLVSIEPTRHIDLITNIVGHFFLFIGLLTCIVFAEKSPEQQLQEKAEGILRQRKLAQRRAEEERENRVKERRKAAKEREIQKIIEELKKE